MLHILQDLSDPFSRYLRDDPVRPEILPEVRVGPGRAVFILRSGDSAQAVLCCKYMNSVPDSVSSLLSDHGEQGAAAIFYSIWSYSAGAGRDLILAARSWIMEQQPWVQQWITLSPQTEMARRFHLKNGARVYRTNADTVNYIYE